jgi:hypothetical protein
MSADHHPRYSLALLEAKCLKCLRRDFLEAAMEQGVRGIAEAHGRVAGVVDGCPMSHDRLVFENVERDRAGRRLERGEDFDPVAGAPPTIAPTPSGPRYNASPSSKSCPLRTELSVAQTPTRPFGSEAATAWPTKHKTASTAKILRSIMVSPWNVE